jgi:hypothetical protein
MAATAQGIDMSLRTWRAALRFAMDYGDEFSLGGGEPTLQRGLAEAMREVRALGVTSVSLTSFGWMRNARAVEVGDKHLTIEDADAAGSVEHAEAVRGGAHEVGASPRRAEPMNRLRWRVDDEQVPARQRDRVGRGQHRLAFRQARDEVTASAEHRDDARALVDHREVCAPRRGVHEAQQFVARPNGRSPTLGAVRRPDDERGSRVVVLRGGAVEEGSITETAKVGPVHRAAEETTGDDVGAAGADLALDGAK